MTKTTIAASLLLLIAPRLQAQGEFWGELKAGRHGVGFRAVYQSDPARSYDPDYPAADRAAVKKPRPILAAIWYPAPPEDATLQITLNSGAVTKQGVTFYVDGTTAIPQGTISARLVQLYSGGGNTHLMTGIAGKESTWMQFGAKCGRPGAFTLFGKSGQWPTESCGVGNYVGLMQIPATMVDAYDWTQNTLDAVNLFANDKLGRAGRYEAALRSKYPKLPALTLQQSEYDGVAFYGPPSTVIAKTGLAYWIPNTNRSGWMKNPNTGVTSYVDLVYSNIR